MSSFTRIRASMAFAMVITVLVLSHTAYGQDDPVGCCWGGPVEWSEVPAWLSPLPRAGFFPNPPSTPGYFSAVDWVQGEHREKRPPSGYPPFALMANSFFDADFRYVESKPVEDRTIVEKLKRIHLTDCLLFSTGGQAWVRFNNENNSRLTEVQNNYALPRVRAYGDVWFADVARVYGEYLWADSINAELPPAAIDEDRGDILNLFLDVNVMEWDGAPVVARVGRQELLLGSQRLVSPLDWANTRRTFEGVRAFRHGEKWDLDAFWVQFVLPLPDKFDRPEENQDLMGAWATYRREKGEFLDFYYLFLNNTNNINRQGITEAPVEVSTLGSRWTGDECSYLWDFEGAVQFGDRGNSDLVAGMATAGVGKHMEGLRGSPTGWLYYDFASGDADPNGGTSHTFNHLYPFGHYYLGWADLVGRQNIHDASAQLYFYPNHWTSVWLQYHQFWLAEARDALYNAAGAAYRRDPTGQAGTHVGQEFDIVVNFHLTDTSDILLAYCKLWGGEFLEGTAGPNQAADADVMYFIYQVKW
ncbi:MAG: alginate export family protein [Pirellulaceae bacterium]